MKKLLLVLIAVHMITASLDAQKIYIRLAAGAGLGLNQSQGTQWADETETNTSHLYEIKSMSLGSGFNVHLACGYMFSENIGIEMGVNENIGLNNKVETSYTSDYVSETGDATLSGMMLQIIPAVVITPGLAKLNPYARLGMIAGVLPSVIQTSNSTINHPTLGVRVENEKEKNYGGVALGFTAAGGVDFKLNEKIALSAELVYNGITYAPAKGKYLVYTVDGVDQLPLVTTKGKEWTYEKDYDALEHIPADSPAKRPAVSMNFSNVELNLGVKVKL
jgi:opacity protein-like surface antigen